MVFVFVQRIVSKISIYVDQVDDSSVSFPAMFTSPSAGAKLDSKYWVANVQFVKDFYEIDAVLGGAKCKISLKIFKNAEE